MGKSEFKFINAKKVRSVIVHYHTVQKKTIKHWFSSEEVSEEVKIFSTKVIFSNGIPVKEERIEYNPEGVYRKRTSFQNGLPILIETLDPNGKITEKIENEYYPSGKIKKESEFKNDELESLCYYEYDNKGSLIESKYISYSLYNIYDHTTNFSVTYSEMNGNNVETHINLKDKTKRIYVYDSYNRRIMLSEYDEKGHITKKIETFYNNDGLESGAKLDDNYIERLKYDEHGNLIRMEWYPYFRGDQPNPSKKYLRAITIFEYIYDYQGNWIELRQYRDGVYNLLQTRQIEYID